MDDYGELMAEWMIERTEKSWTEFEAWLGRKKSSEFDEWLEARRER